MPLIINTFRFYIKQNNILSISKNGINNDTTQIIFQNLNAILFQMIIMSYENLHYYFYR